MIFIKQYHLDFDIQATKTKLMYFKFISYSKSDQKMFLKWISLKKKKKKIFILTENNSLADHVR